MGLQFWNIRKWSKFYHIFPWRALVPSHWHPVWQYWRSVPVTGHQGSPGEDMINLDDSIMFQNWRSIQFVQIDRITPLGSFGAQSLTPVFDSTGDFFEKSTPTFTRRISANIQPILMGLFANKMANSLDYFILSNPGPTLTGWRVIQERNVAI